MIALLIWSAWLILGSTVFWILPHLPLPKVFHPGSNKILRLQVTLFIMGWMGKLFAGGLYFTAGKYHAIALAACSLAALYAVFVIGCIFRKHPSKTEQIEELKKQLEALGVQVASPQADQTQCNRTSEQSPSPREATLSLAELENRIRARRGA